MGEKNKTGNNHQTSLAGNADGKEISHEQEEKRQKYRLLTVILSFVIVVALIALFYTQYHTWSDASCTAARTCTICGKTEGNPLGHTWVEANCTTAKTCAICGKTEGNLLGHTWVEATYYSPKSCSRCNSTEGYSLAKKLDDTTVQASYLDNNINFQLSNGKEVGGSAWGLSQPVKDCVSITINLNVSNLTDGNVYGEWGFWVHDLNGNWFLAEVFNYAGGTTTATLEFDNPISFDMILVPCHVLGDSWSFSYSIWLSDAWVLRN